MPRLHGMDHVRRNLNPTLEDDIEVNRLTSNAKAAMIQGDVRMQDGFKPLKTTHDAVRKVVPHLQRVRHSVQGRHILPEDIRMSLQRLFEACHVQSDPSAHQNAICNLGGVMDLTALAHTADNHTQLFIFTVLGQIGFSNEDSARVIGNDQNLLYLVLHKLASSDHVCSAKLKQYCIFSLTNAVANAWDCHPHLSALFEPLVRLLETSTDKFLLSQCVLTLGNFSYNEHTRGALLDVGALAPLKAVVASNDPDLLPTSAAVAVANLMGGLEDEMTASSAVMVLVMDAFRAALTNEDFPAGSSIYYTDWKMAKGMHHLAKNRANRSHLRQAGLMPLLEEALMCQDKRTLRAVQEILWLLSADEAPDEHETRDIQMY